MGVKGAPVFYKLKCPFSLTTGFAIDWMHCVPLGVVKYFFNLMISPATNGKIYNIGKFVDLIDRRLTKIKPPHTIGRFPRSIEDRDHWKATELKNWLIHYSVAVLYKVLCPLYLLHWSLLVTGVAILCSDSINDAMCIKAGQMLNDFVALLEPLYGIDRCTMNAHQLIHLAYYVKKMGPLWCYSCYAFEGFNAYLKALVHGTHHAAQQIACSLGLTMRLKPFVQKVVASGNVPKSTETLLCKFSGIKDENKGVKTPISNGGYFLGKPRKAMDEITENTIKFLATCEGLCNEMPEFQYYGRYTAQDGNLYYSMIHGQSKMFNSTVISYQRPESEEISYGILKTFIKVKMGNEAFCVIHKLDEMDDPFCFQDSTIDFASVDASVQRILDKYLNQRIVYHQKAFKSRLGDIAIIRLEQIIKKCVLIDILDDCWIISNFPNNVEPQ